MGPLAPCRACPLGLLLKHGGTKKSIWTPTLHRLPARAHGDFSVRDHSHQTIVVTGRQHADVAHLLFVAPS
jgi:hypothetical protein